MYAHFTSECLKSCDSSEYYSPDDTFNFSKLIVQNETKLSLNDNELFDNLNIKL